MTPHSTLICISGAKVYISIFPCRQMEYIIVSYYLTILHSLCTPPLFSHPCIILDRPPALSAIMYAYVLFPVTLFQLSVGNVSMYWPKLTGRLLLFLFPFFFFFSLSEGLAELQEGILTLRSPWVILVTFVCVNVFKAKPPPHPPTDTQTQYSTHTHTLIEVYNL